MQLFIEVLAGTFGTFVLTQSSLDGSMEGPFYLYNLVRWLATHNRAPKLIKAGATCPVCISFWVAALFAVLIGFLRPWQGWTMWAASMFVLTYGMHGAYIFYIKWLKAFYAMGASDLN